jgi:hypothetical protein
MKWVFSLFSGELYEVSDAEVAQLDAFQLVLKDKPKESCSSCRGKFRTTFYITEKRWNFCKRCARKLAVLPEVKLTNHIGKA